MEHLHSDILTLILRQIDARHLSLSVRRVCSRWNQLMKEERFWKEYLGLNHNVTDKSWHWLAISKTPFMSQKVRNGVGRLSNVLVLRGGGPSGDSGDDHYEGELIDGRYCYGSRIAKTRLTILDWSSPVPTIHYIYFDGRHCISYCDEKYMNYIMISGARYVGTVTNKRKPTIPLLYREGKGKFIWPDGAFYVGEWNDDLRSGYGYMQWADGTSYSGEWKDDQRIFSVLNEDWMNNGEKRWDNIFRLNSPSELDQHIVEMMKTLPRNR